MHQFPKIRVWFITLSVVLLLTGVAAACPTCKDNLAHDPSGQSLARGYAYSILFMLSMPPLILGGLSAYFYWEVRKAKKRPHEPPAASELAASPQ